MPKTTKSGGIPGESGAEVGEIGQRLSEETFTDLQKFVPLWLEIQYNNEDTMIKVELVKEIANTTGVPQEDVLTIVERFMTTVKDSLAQGESVTLRGFGTFQLKQRAEKAARNISQNTRVIVPAHNIPSFKPAKCFKDEVADQR